jgi:hypothetical protein
MSTAESKRSSAALLNYHRVVIRGVYLDADGGQSSALVYRPLGCISRRRLQDIGIEFVPIVSLGEITMGECDMN